MSIYLQRWSEKHEKMQGLGDTPSHWPIIRMTLSKWLYTLFCSIEKQISDTMKKAFWDSLQEKLSSQPPDYSHALVLIEEVREVRIITVINFNSVWHGEPTALSINQPPLVRILSKDNIFTCQLDGLKCFALGYCHPPVTLDYENLPLFRTNLSISGKIYGLSLSLVRLLQFIW